MPVDSGVTSFVLPNSLEKKLRILGRDLDGRAVQCALAMSVAWGELNWHSSFGPTATSAALAGRGDFT